ncbi:unnamed protein product, partial [Thlaspi arvense]
ERERPLLIRYRSSSNMGRSPGSDETGMKKGPWLPEEDDKLISYIHKHGHSSWSALPKLAGTISLHKSLMKPRWSMIASHLPGRTDNEIKNFWNTHLKKKLIQMGFDPMTHRPRTDDIFSSLSQLMSLSNLRGLVDLQRQFPIGDQAFLNLQAEMAKLQLFHYLLQPPPLPMSNSSSSISPNELNILNLLIKENSNTINLDQGLLNSCLQDFSSNLPSLKTLDENHFSQNNSPLWLHEPQSLTQTMLPSHDPSGLSDDMARSVDGFGCNLKASSNHDQEGAATGSVDWPDLLFDDSIFPDIPYQS